MAKKKTNKAASQPKGNSKTPVAEKSAPTLETLPEQEFEEQELFAEQIEQPAETQDSPTDEQSDETESSETKRDFEIFFELGEDDEEEGISVEITSIEEEATTKEQASIEETITETTPKKAKKNKFGNAETAKLAGCSYHFFRKYFKKRYTEEGIKVRFVKAATGYNGHIEVAETDIERAKGIILKIKSEQMDVKNLFWFL